VTLSYFVHATEDAERLNRTVCEAFGVNESELGRESLEGHYGNKLEFVKAHLVGGRAEQVVKRIAKRLTDDSKRLLQAQLENSMDEHDALYLRMDRQSIDEGFSISDQEPIRVKIKPKFRAGDRETMRQAFEEGLEL